MPNRRAPFEWITLALILACYAVWGLSVFWLSTISLWLAIPVAGASIALHSSLTHEAIHGHPFHRAWLNAALMFPALTLCVPYMRFRDSHLAHHTDARLTDPYDDPESNYLDPAVWERLAPPLRWVLALNNTLAGRLLIGPLVGQIAWMIADVRAIGAGDRAALSGWLWHLPALALALALVAAAPIPLWAYLVAAYIGLAILKIRTFLEHQAHERVRVFHGVFLEEVEEELVHVDDASDLARGGVRVDVVRVLIRTVRPILRVYLWRGVFGLVDDDPARDVREHGLHHHRRLLFRRGAAERAGRHAHLVVAVELGDEPERGRPSAMAGVAGFSAVREQDAGSAEGDGSASSEVRSGPRMDADGGQRDGPEAHGCGREHRSGHDGCVSLLSVTRTTTETTVENWLFERSDALLITVHEMARRRHAPV